MNSVLWNLNSSSNTQTRAQQKTQYEGQSHDSEKKKSDGNFTNIKINQLPEEDNYVANPRFEGKLQLKC